MSQKEKNRKIRAILAGGMVLGVGAAVTLAAWSDSEFAEGIFGTGAFDLEGSATGIGYSSHTEGNAVDLSFPLDASEISADQTIQAPFAVRLSEATTENANVTMAAEFVGSINGLSYEVYKTESFGCVGLTTPFALGAFDGIPTSEVQAFTLDQGTTSAGPEQNLCFVVKADASLQQGANSTVIWQFEARKQ